VSFARRVLPSLIFAGALAGLVLQRRCAAPVAATPRQLWTAHETWAGRRVETIGAMKVFSPGTPDAHFALEDDGYRVGVRGLPPAAAAAWVGRRVTARGTFVFTEKTGGYLDAPELSPAP
jgi:hypothetical protein